MDGQEEKKCCYVMKKIEKKGYGCFATRDINIGELIISEEEPIFCMRNRDVNQRNLIAMKNAISTLNETELNSFRNLACYKDYQLDDNKKDNDDKINDENSKLSRMYDIWNTNAIDLDSSQLYSGVFGKISRVNHSCQSNCRYRPNMSDGTMDIICVYNIKKDEEITVDYCARFVDLASKRRKLKVYFDCQCIRCIKKNFDESNKILEKFCTLTKSIDKQFEKERMKREKTQTDNLIELINLFNMCYEAITLARSDFAPSIQFEALQPLRYQKIVLALLIVPLLSTSQHASKVDFKFNVKDIKSWIQHYFQLEIVMKRETDALEMEFDQLVANVAGIEKST